jgi:hypothetical protein
MNTIQYEPSIIHNDGRLEMTLVKKQYYPELKPYGKFIIKWVTKQGHLPNIIPFNELQFDSRQGMPIDEQTDKVIIKFMKKYKTDVLTDGHGTFYTRCGSGFCEIQHKKLLMYRNNEEFRNIVDGGDSFAGVILNNK